MLQVFPWLLHGKLGATGRTGTNSAWTGRYLPSGCISACNLIPCKWNHSFKIVLQHLLRGEKNKTTRKIKTNLLLSLSVYCFNANYLQLRLTQWQVFFLVFQKKKKSKWRSLYNCSLFQHINPHGNLKISQSGSWEVACCKINCFTETFFIRYLSLTWSNNSLWELQWSEKQCFINPSALRQF